MRLTFDHFLHSSAFVFALSKCFLNPFDFSHFYWVFWRALNVDDLTSVLDLKSEFSKNMPGKKTMFLPSRTYSQTL